MIDQKALYDLISNPHLKLECTFPGHPQALFDAAAVAVAEEGLQLSHFGLFSNKTSMLPIPVGQATTIEEAMKTHGLTPKEQIGLFAGYSATGKEPVIIQFPGPSPFDGEHPALVYVRLPMGPGALGDPFHATVSRLVRAIDARRGIGWLPTSRPFGVPKRKHVEEVRWRGTWERMESFSWLNLIDDPALLKWIHGLGAEAPFARVTPIDGGRAVLTLWETPLTGNRRAGMKYGLRVWKAARSGRRPPRAPRVLLA